LPRISWPRARNLFVDVGDFKLPLPADHAAKGFIGKSVTLGIRPEMIFDKHIDSHIKPTAANTITAKVDVLEPLGYEYVAYLNLGSHNFIATIDTGTKIKEGQSSEFVISLDAIHLFDDETELAIR